MFGSKHHTLSNLIEVDEIVFEFSSDRRDDLDDASARILDESFRNNGRLVNATLVA